jgi:hypothetical protein
VAREHLDVWLGGFAFRVRIYHEGEIALRKGVQYEEARARGRGEACLPLLTGWLARALNLQWEAAQTKERLARLKKARTAVRSHSLHEDRR